MIYSGVNATSTPPPDRRSVSGLLNPQKRAQCTPGTRSFTGNTPCSPCPPGTYSNANGARLCMPARPGYFVQGTGGTTETPCAPGTFALLPGADHCLPCVAGTFNNINAATRCCLCCAGYSTASQGSTSCQACPASRPYSPPGSNDDSRCSATPGILSGTPATSCIQNPATDICPVLQGLLSTHGLTRRNSPRRQPCPRRTQRHCPIYKSTAVSGHGTAVLSGYECVDVAHDLESCGGCVGFSQNGKPSGDGGRDCSSIPHVDSVRCSSGKCAIGESSVIGVCIFSPDSCWSRFLPPRIRKRSQWRVLHCHGIICWAMEAARPIHAVMRPRST
ncbi:hypothetical protein BD779DRAFT_1441412 [Infundibulicybe gibba]|nr:hypothetical protein BD779DRAFT_1441412 [Infundibulicybe gibba]